MGDGDTEWPGCGPLWISVNPLVIAGRLSEGINVVLGDLMPLAVSQVGTNRRQQLLRTGKLPHAYTNPARPGASAAGSKPRVTRSAGASCRRTIAAANRAAAGEVWMP